MKQTAAELQEELQAIIAWFESDDADIDQAVAKYKQGIALVRELQVRLKQTENTITKLTKTFTE